MIYKGNEITRGYYYESNKNLNNGLLWYSSWGDDTEDERNAKIIAKKTWF
jgi:hypothetical protein